MYIKSHLSIAFILALFSMTLHAAIAPLSAENLYREYRLKAAFLRYAVEFVEWPPEAIPESAINICIYGDIPSLEGINAINGKIVNNRSIVIRTIQKLDIVKSGKQECQILYLGDTKGAKLSSIIQEMKNLPVLTFGDKEGLAEKGGGMNFYSVNKRLGIMINQETIAKNKLNINPRMLKLVTIIPHLP